ncbi:MAG: LysR substrate-binding domain-containing protein [Hyphomicrobiales bacterium]|nr:LysR substrate-binding domain-containing protein [Hyphomicrobiales bacterium]
MNSGLPPLRALRAFEAVVRCGSITAAAADLGVTHGAVSKQVAQLEDWFGRRLFRRMATGVRPTPETRAFAEQVGEAFHRMRRASEALANVQCDDRELLVLAPATFAMQWLVPRLSGFGNPQSDAPIRVQTSQTTDDWEAFTFDVAIRRGFAPVRGYRTIPFLRESLTLLAPPAMERDLKAGGPDGLAGLTLLSADTRPHELERWLEAAGLVPTGRDRRQRFGHFHIMLQAVLNGLGPAVGPLPVLAGEVMAGRLAVPFPEIAIPGVTYSAVVPEASETRRDVRAFVQWIERESKASETTFDAFCDERQMSLSRRPLASLV